MLVSHWTNSYILMFSLLELLYFYFSENFLFPSSKIFISLIFYQLMTSYAINFFFPFILFHFLWFFFFVVILVSVFCQEALSFTFKFSFECVFIMFFFGKKIFYSIFFFTFHGFVYIVLMHSMYIVLKNRNMCLVEHIESADLF